MIIKSRFINTMFLRVVNLYAHEHNIHMIIVCDDMMFLKLIRRSLITLVILVLIRIEKLSNYMFYI